MISAVPFRIFAHNIMVAAEQMTANKTIRIAAKRCSPSKKVECETCERKKQIVNAVEP